MPSPIFDAKAILAVLIVVCSFSVLILYIALNRVPDGYAIAIVSAAISGVTAAYFGHSNGVTTGLALAATSLANRTNPGDAVSEARKDVPVVP